MKKQTSILLSLTAVAGTIFSLSLTDVDTVSMPAMEIPLALPALGNDAAPDSLPLVPENTDSIMAVRRQQAFDIAVTDYETIRNLRAQGEPEETYFPAVYRCYTDNIEALGLIPSDAPEYNRIKGILRDIHRYLEEGAFYYSGKNNSPQMVNFAQAFVEIKTMAPFAEANMPVNETYYTSLI